MRLPFVVRPHPTRLFLVGAMAFLLPLLLLMSLHGSTSRTSPLVKRALPFHGLMETIVNNQLTEEPANATGEYAGPWASTPPREDPRPLLYNRVPKSGSEMFVLLLQWLQGYNGYKHVRLPNKLERRLELNQQAELLREMQRHQATHGVPCSFDRHVYFINFTQFGEAMPLYVNLVRDPVEKAVSRYFYHHIGFSEEYDKLKPNMTRDEWKRQYYERCVRERDPLCEFVAGESYDLTIPYFCGHHPRCMILNDTWALEQAKQNLQNHYTVVGVLELLNETLAVLEHHLPFYFTGVADMFYKELLVPKRNKNLERPRQLAQDVRDRLRANLTLEYELYDFARQRLLHQFAAITNLPTSTKLSL